MPEPPKDSRARPLAVEEILGFFGWKWAGFWAWLDTIGHNVPPIPTSRASGSTAPERPDTPLPPK